MSDPVDDRKQDEPNRSPGAGFTIPMPGPLPQPPAPQPWIEEQADETEEQTKNRVLTNGATAEHFLNHPLFKGYFENEFDIIGKALRENRYLPLPAGHEAYIALHTWAQLLEKLRGHIRGFIIKRDDLRQEIWRKENGLDPEDDDGFELNPGFERWELNQYRDPDLAGG